MKKGDKVIYKGCTTEQVNWGSHSDPRGILTPGSVYKVSKVEVHTWHTKVSLVGIDGNFNSGCFEQN